MFVTALVAVLTVTALPAAQAPSRPRIVVIEGENAVNIVQQRTAVTPVVEVRDRNDQPVAGVIVRFAIGRGNATFSGARTVSVTTNVAGRAAATGFTPTGAGALQISATATLQGQTAAATIVQTNVMTAAQAAGAASAGASGGSGSTAGAGGAAGGGSGGVSATTIGIVGGAVAGGAVATQQVVGGESGTLYSGPFSARYARIVVNVSNGANPCTADEGIDGTVSVRLEEHDGSVSGSARVMWTHTGFASGTCTGITPGSFTRDYSELAISGSPVSFSFNQEEQEDVTLPTGVPVRVTHRYVFVGALSGETVTGTLTYTNQDLGTTRVGNSSVPMPITLALSR